MIEAVIDKDHASGLLARDLGADAYLMPTDVEGSLKNWGTPNQSLVTKTTPQDLQRMSFPAGSMGP
jgi:carbamate kinase